MKKNVLAILFIFILISTTTAVYADYDYEKIEVEVTEVPYKPVYAYLGLHFMAGNGQAGGDMGLTSARNSDLQLESYIGYRNVSTVEGTNLGVFDMMLGGSFFPRRPVFKLGDMDARLKVSALGGLGLSNDMLFTMLFSAGFVFSSPDDPSGFTADLIYSPSVSAGETKIPSLIGIRIGFLFAPIAPSY